MDAVDRFERWILDLHQDRPFGPDDRLGVANLIDNAVRVRAASCIQTGDYVRLARRLGSAIAPDGTPAMTVQTDHWPAWRTLGHGVAAGLGVGVDTITVDCHGSHQTHMDGLNHLSLNGHFYGGRAWGDEGIPTIVDLASVCFFTRAVVADIPAVRGTPWVEADRPVSGTDLDAALDGVVVHPGDALLLYMGRDRLEASGWEMPAGGEEMNTQPRPGVGADGARWIADHRLSVVCWDLMDAVHPDEPGWSVHQLTIAIGLVLVDNCDLSAAAATCAELGRRTGALSVQPIGVPGGTGSIVEPMLIL